MRIGLRLTNFCRAGNVRDAPDPFGTIQWNQSGVSVGDWNPKVPYHWWPFADAGNPDVY